MKKIGCILILLMLLFLKVSAQVINLNPDPYGESWAIGPGNAIGDSSAPFIVNSEA